MAIKTRNVVFKFDAEAKDAQQRLDRLAKDLQKVETEYQGAKKGSLEWHEAQRKLIQIQKQLGQSTDNSTAKTTQWGQTMKRAGQSILALAGIAGIGAIINDATRTVIDFDQALADLSSITGATGGDLEFLENRAREFGKTTTVSAAEAIEAFKLVGSAKPELLQNAEALAQVTAEAITLSEAAGFDLPTAAENLGSALNALNLPAEDAGRVVNVLAAASQKGAREIPFLTTAFSKFGGVAAQANISLEESAAAVELLGAKIPEASVVGTNLRGIMIRLQTAAAEQGREFKGLRGELDTYADSVGDITLLKKVFGEENLLAAQTLIAEREQLTAMQEAITGTNTAYQQAETRTSTLGGSLLRLRNAWQDLVLRLNAGSGLASRVVRTLADNLDTVVKVIGSAVAAVVSYRVAVFAMSNAQAIATVAVNAFRIAKIGMTSATRAATVATRTFNTTMRANPIGLVVSALTTAVALLWDWGDAADDAAEGQKALNEQVQAAQRLQSGFDDIGRQVKVVSDFSKTQVENLLGSIDQQIAATEEKLSRVQALDETLVSGTDEKSQALRLELALQQQIAQEARARLNSTQTLTAQEIEYQKERLATAESAAKSIIEREEGVTEEVLREQKAQLEAYKLTAQERLKAIGSEDDKAPGGGVMAGTIAALSEEVSQLQEDVVKKFQIGSDEFGEAVEKYIDKARELEEAQALIRGSRQTFEAGSLKELQERVAQLNAEVEATSATADNFDDLIVRLRAAQAEVKALQERISETSGPVDFLKLQNEDLAEAERHQLAMAQITKQGEQRILDIKIAFAKARLELLREEGKVSEDEYQKQLNALKELEAQKVEAVAKSNEQQVELDKEKVAEILWGIEQVLAATIQSLQQIIDARIAEVDSQIELQQGRVDQIMDIASEGNAELLKLEEERLEKLRERREKYVRQMQALATLEVIAQTAVAVANAAAQGGAGAAFTIAAALIALAAGLASAKSMASNAAYFDGGYTGDGNPYEESTAVGPRPYTYHKKEFVMDHKVTGIGRNKEIFDWILKGRVDLQEAFNQRNITISPAGGVSDKKMDELISAVNGKPVTSINLSKDGIFTVVKQRERKDARIKKRLS